MVLFKGKYILTVLLVLVISTIAKSSKLGIDTLHRFNEIINQQVKCNALNQLAITLKEDTALSAKNAQMAYQLASAINYSKGMAQALLTLGIIYKNQGNFNQAKINYISALSLALKINDKKSIALANHSLGNLANIKGDFAIALRYYFTALSYSEDINDKERIARTLNNIATIYLALDNLVKSEEYTLKAINIFKELNNQFFVAQLENNLAIIYYNQDNISKALFYYTKALKVFRKMNQSAEISSSLNNIGSIYLKQLKPTVALVYYRESYKIDINNWDLKATVTSLINFAKCFNLLDKHDSALHYALSAVKLAKKGNFLDELSVAYKTTAEVYSNLGNHNKFLLYFNAYEKLQEKLIGKQNILEISNIQNKYEAQKKEFELKLVLKDMELKEVKIAEQKSQLVQKTVSMWLGGIFLLLVAINVLLLIYFLGIKKQIKDLSGFTSFVQIVKK